MTPIEFTSPPLRILIIKPSAIGDVVHALPVLNLLRGKWPQAKISWLVTPACAGLLDGHSQLDEVIRFERRRFGQSWRDPTAAAGLFGFARDMRERQFDLAIDLQGLFRSGWLSASTRAPVRVGPAGARELGWVFYTHRINTGTAELHAVERNLRLAEALGLGREPVKFVFPTDDEDRRFVATLAPNGLRYAVFLPGANWDTKRWPPEKFAACVAPLRERFGLESIVAGGSIDTPLAAQIPGALDLTGRTDLRQLVALLERAQLVIANDTGPMHIAAALGRPLVTMYGPTSPARTGPYGRMGSVVYLDIECRPCLGRHCSHTSCLRKLEPDSILQLAAEQMMAEAPSGRTTPLRVVYTSQNP
ncbi:MAG TPA: lipopolysaccharide heptosyltransferase II [Tepidisphaeraceae bacterium]|nr:lipopolysaccharide heptosyltransferase II [Tepidisphaeraceae bacterium]